MSQNYCSMNDVEKEKIIRQLYEKENYSFMDIASKLNTYANKIRRDAKKFNINIKNKSEAQKNALNTGKHKHPTKNKGHNEQTKKKIGLSVVENWDSMSEAELDNRRNKAKENWEKLSNDTKKNMRDKANRAVRVSSKTGSKLENYILEKLLELGYKVDFHKEQALVNTKLQIDLYIPELSTAIEVDGPSHFLPVWGEDVLKRNIAYDQKKTGLILGKGMVIIRVKQVADFSPTRADSIVQQLSTILDNIKREFPQQDKRSFLIEDK
jgi:very-short-patch-repair endonuclease